MDCSRGRLLWLAVTLGAALLGACRKTPAPEPPVAVAPREEPAETEGADAGTAVAGAPDTTDINYWREQVRKVAGHNAPDAGADAVAPPREARAATERADAGGNPELRLGTSAVCEKRVPNAMRQFNEGAVVAAEVELRVVLKDDPGCAAAHLLMGQILSQRGDLKAALAELEEAERLAPGLRGLDALIAKLKKEMGLALAQEDSAHFVVSFDGQADKEAEKKAVESLEEARRVVGKAFDYFPSDAVPVILYPGKTFREAQGQATWSVGIFDGKIRLPASGAEHQPDEFRSTLYHEYTHALVYRMASGQRVPAWLNEGVAMYAETLAPGSRGRVRVARGGAWVPLTRLHNSFTGLDERSAQVAYAEAQLAVAELVQSYRLYRIRELLERLGQGRSFESAFEDTYLVSYETFAKHPPGR